MFQNRQVHLEKKMIRGHWVLSWLDWLTQSPALNRWAINRSRALLCLVGVQWLWRRWRRQGKEAESCLAPLSKATLSVQELMTRTSRVELFSRREEKAETSAVDPTPVYFIDQSFGLADGNISEKKASVVANMRAGTRKVTLIILTWNGLSYTKRCLETLRRHTTHPNYETLVVDNGSSDGTVEYLRGLPWIRLIENGANLGFVRGNNRGLDAVGPGSDVVLLNNDMEVHQPDWLERLQEAADRSPDIGIVGCRLVHPSGKLLHAGTYLPTDTYWGQQIGGGEEDINQFPGDREVEGIVFACAYIKRSVLDAVGPLDEDYFSYFEDTDYCLKARLQGFRTVCSGRVTLVHHENVSTQINGVSHNRMFLRSQKIFRRKWDAYLNRTRYHYHLDWRSIMNLPTGYANSCRELLLALDRRGIEVAYRYAYGRNTPFPLDEPEEAGHYVLNCIRSRPLVPGGVQVVYAQGDVFQSNDAAYRVGFTMLETDKFPAEWVRQANSMDEVWVPSRFNQMSLADSGVQRPIHVVPLGVDPNYFHPTLRGFPNRNVFTFLSVFEWGERKAPEILLRAFCDEFSAQDDVVLVCKTMNRDGNVNVRDAIRELKLPNGGGRVILSLNDIIAPYELGCLYRSADCFVLPTRGEGWGMPVLEAMACGLPVIATRCSALTDFLDDSNGYPLEIEGMVPAQARCPYYQGARWAQPSYDHLRSRLREVYEHREAAHLKGQIAAQMAADNWTWDHSAERIEERLKMIDVSGPRRRVA